MQNRFFKTCRSHIKTKQNKCEMQLQQNSNDEHKITNRKFRKDTS